MDVGALELQDLIIEVYITQCLVMLKLYVQQEKFNVLQNKQNNRIASQYR